LAKDGIIDQGAYEAWLRAVGRCIAGRRKELGWTQANAASACSLDFKFYQDLEYGRRPCSTRTLFGVATGLQVQIYYLFPRPEEFSTPVKSVNESVVVEKTAKKKR